MEGWIRGVPQQPEPDRLYAIMAKPESGYSVGCVIRGEDCNWRSCTILAHYPLPMSMSKAEALALKRFGRIPERLIRNQ